MIYMIKKYSQGLSFYPLDGLEHNADDGLKCCFTLYNMNSGNMYPEDLKCGFALLLEIGYIIPVLLLGFFLQLIMTASGEKYHRVPVVVGFSTSFTAMALYAELLPEVGAAICFAMPEFGSGFAALYVSLSLSSFLMLLLHPSLMHRCQDKVSTHLPSRELFPSLEGCFYFSNSP